MKKSLLVTLANSKYVDQAKQLFSSVYFNAGWKGDYMLLAYDIPEKDLEWFRKKGILIKKCKSFAKIDGDNHAKLSKFYMFTSEFGKWKNVIYLDSDIIVRGSLHELTKIKGFAAVPDDLVYDRLFDLFDLFSKDNKFVKRFCSHYTLFKKTFNSGVMAFSTDVIKQNSFLKLKNILNDYGEFRNKKAKDQPLLNLFFYDSCFMLPLVYNLDMRDVKSVSPGNLNAIILHFIGGYKPWMPDNPFYDEWKSNLDKAYRIDLKNIPTGQKEWSKFRIRTCSFYLNFIQIFHISFWTKFVNHSSDLIGVFLYLNLPKIYFMLKRLKNGKT